MSCSISVLWPFMSGLTHVQPWKGQNLWRRFSFLYCLFLSCFLALLDVIDRVSGKREHAHLLFYYCRVWVQVPCLRRECRRLPRYFPRGIGHRIWGQKGSPAHSDWLPVYHRPLTSPGTCMLSPTTKVLQPSGLSYYVSQAENEWVLRPDSCPTLKPVLSRIPNSPRFGKQIVFPTPK